MLTVIFLSLALFLGYTVTVGLSMVATFGITASSPSFVVKEFRIRRRFKFVQDAIWLLCATAGGYATALVEATMNPWLAGIGLVVILVGVLWMNAWEMRQRGVPHQVAMSIMSAAGVALGFAIRLHNLS